MKTTPLLPAALCALLLASPLAVLRGADLVQAGQITLNPSAGPVMLTLQGPGYNNPAVSAYGLTLSYHDYSSGNSVANGLFRLYRPVGQYQWQFSTSTGTARVAMQLGNDHALKLTDPADPANPDKTIELRPGPSDDPDKGIFMNGEKVLSTDGSASFASGNLTISTDGSTLINTSNASTGIDLIVPGSELFLGNNGFLWLENIVLDSNGSASFAGGDVTISPGGETYFADHVGIGTATPAASLDVNGNAALGRGVISAEDQVVVGKYNDTRTNDGGTNHTQGVFIVGSGTATGTSAANALRVLADGTVLVKNSGDISMGTFTQGARP